MKRLYSLDALRGTAALAVVLWHWQHFYAISGVWQEGWQRSAQPFYSVLKPFYFVGWAAVDLFFALSGFVFFWLYAEAIAAGTIGGGKFALLRFSRLYPLHTATFLMVALMQMMFHGATGAFFIYDANTWDNALRTLVMGQQWLPPTLEQSFNGPAWSVSVEVLLYAIFFAAMRSGLTGMRASLDIAGIGIIVFFLYNEMIGRGLMGFFIGGAVYHLVTRIKLRADAARIARWIIAGALLGWAMVAVANYLDPLTVLDRFLTSHMSADGTRFYGLERDNLLLLMFIVFVSPLTLAALALHEQVLGGRYERLSFLGDISYSSYLLHFPLQLALALVALRLGWHPETFENGVALVLFYAALIGLASLSYRYFERPLQAVIRGLGKRALFPAE